MASQTPDPLTVAEAMRVLGLSRRQVLRLVKRGTLTPTVKLAGTTGAYLLDPAQVAALAVKRARS